MKQFLEDIIWEVRYYWREFKTLLRELFKWPYQRVVIGYDDPFVWNYCHSNTRQTLEILRWYRWNRFGTTTKYTEKEFNKLLDTAITGFNSQILMEDEFDIKKWKKLDTVFQKGLKAYISVYPHLWD